MGISGRIAQAFLRSKLTPLVTIAALAVGLLGILAIPREEEPQISVPMIDVIAALAGRVADGGGEPCSRGRSSSACGRSRAWITCTRCRATDTRWSRCASRSARIRSAA